MQDEPLAIEKLSFRWWYSVSLFALCVVCCWMNWLKMKELDFDQARWLFECGRAAAGEFPYRDFSWQFPPLPLAIFAGLFHWFGSTFLVAQIGLDILSAVAVMLFLALARALFRDPIAWALTVLFIAAESAGDTLFTLKLYTPAILTGIIGTLLLLLAAAGFLRTRTFRAYDYLMFSLGAFVCLLSKPEFIIGCLAIWFALTVADRMVFRDRPWGEWFARQSGLAVALSAPAAFVYLWVGTRAGWQNLLQGISGYGGAAHSCPWWPTGFGFFCAAGGLGEGVLLLGIFALADCKPWARYRRLFGLLAIPAAAAALFYTFLIRDGVILYGQQSLVYKVLHYATATNTVLFPFVSLGLAGFPIGVAWLVRHYSRKLSWDARHATLFVLLAAAVSLSVRGLFGTLEGPVPLVSPASQPLWLFWAVALVSPKDRPVKWVGAAVLAYAAVLLLGYLAVEGRRPYPTLQTRAGAVRLREFEPAASVYRFVAQAAQPGDTILELPYGGGFYFAARLKSPLFSTQHILLPIPFHYLDEDLRRIENRPPKLAVVYSAPRFGTNYGGHPGCAFPSVVWKPGGGDSLPDYLYPVVGFLQRNYTVAANYGSLMILTRGER